MEAPPAISIPVLAFSLAPLVGWSFVAWGIVAAILDRHRLQILWEDVRRMRDAVTRHLQQLAPVERYTEAVEV